VLAAAARLGVSPRELDYAIWAYQSGPKRASDRH
jgi:hypothetical protein